eukprot:5259846-Prymnesium_polylepis.1
MAMPGAGDPGIARSASSFVAIWTCCMRGVAPSRHLFFIGLFRAALGTSGGRSGIVITADRRIGSLSLERRRHTYTYRAANTAVISSET